MLLSLRDLPSRLSLRLYVFVTKINNFRFIVSHPFLLSDRIQHILLFLETLQLPSSSRCHYRHCHCNYIETNSFFFSCPLLMCQIHTQFSSFFIE